MHMILIQVLSLFPCVVCIISASCEIFLPILTFKDYTTRHERIHRKENIVKLSIGRLRLLLVRPPPVEPPGARYAQQQFLI